jgi:GEVED domain/Right handed beta helix region
MVFNDAIGSCRGFVRSSESIFLPTTSGQSMEAADLPVPGSPRLPFVGRSDSFETLSQQLHREPSPAMIPLFRVLVSAGLGSLTIAAATFTVSITNDSGAGSLRAAMTNANVTPGPDLIVFNLPADTRTLTPLTALPILTDPVTLDGTTQPGFTVGPLVELSGASAPGGSSGLRLATSNSVIRGLVVNRWRAHGIEINGGRGHAVENCYLGIGSQGTNDLGNGNHGILIANSAANRVGGPDPKQGNVISGNEGNGIRLDGLNATNNVLLGNRIGTDGAGGQPLPNGGAGIEVGGNARFNRIGGLTPGEGNLLAFNRGDGVLISSGTNNAVRGNRHHSNTGLGVDLGSNGILANDATDADSGANQQQNFPILIRAVLDADSTEVTGELRSTPASAFEVDLFASDTADPSGNGEGEQFLGTFSVTTDASGLARFTNVVAAATPHRFLSVTATDSQGNTSEFSPALRALTTRPPNTFEVTVSSDAGPGSLRQAIQDATNAFNLGDRITFKIPGAGPHTLSPVTALPPLSAPVTLDGFTQPGSRPNTLVAGFDADHRIFLDGAAAPANTDGLLITTPGVVVRGLGITRFRGDGIELSPSSSGALIEGCLIGLGSDGSDQGQNASGVFINGSPGHRIGGTTPEARNLLSGNGQHGIVLSGAGATRTRIEGNWIGPGLDGRVDRGNSQQGIRCDNAPGNILGGSVPGAGNVIAGNDQNGIEFNNAGSSNNVVQGNFIGVAASGGALKNNASGIAVAASGNRMGGPLTGEGNWIGFNGQRGVAVLSGTNNVIRGNQIHLNDGIGIDLGNNNVTANDPGDADSGANQLQNFPVLTSGQIEPGRTRIAGILNSRASSSVVIDFYSSPAPDRSGSGEGDQYLGSHEVITDASGNASFEALLNVQASSRHLSATATDAAGNTSEFSTNRLATTSLPATTFTVTTSADEGPGSLRQALLAADAIPAAAPHVIRFNIPGDGPHVIALQSALPVPALEAVILDGYSQPGARANTLASGNDAVLKVILDGTDRPVARGLRLLVPGNTIRGLAVVSFRQDGLLLGGSNQVVEGCFIGLLPDGSARGNGFSGIVLANSLFGSQGASFSRIGGSAPAQRNVIGGQGVGNGIFIAGGGGSNNVILGNYIGTDPAGTAVRSNRTGIQISGVDSPDNRVGGAAPGEGNLISGQTEHGIQFSTANRTLVLGNLIGTEVTGRLPLPNAENGVTVSAAPGSRIGDVTPGAGNRIAFNGRSGVELSSSGGSTNLTVRGNAIFGNGQLGFDVGSFGNVDFNDPGDTDSGANFRQNFPEITAATVEATAVSIAGTLDSLPNGTYQIDLYANREVESSAHGEGEQYLGSVTVTTDAGGDARFEGTFPVVAVGLFMTAIATDAFGNSSEYSAAFKARSSVGGATFQVTTTQDSGPGSLRQAILDSNANPSSGNRIEFNIPGSGPHVLQPTSLLPAITAAVTIDAYSQPGAVANTGADAHNAVLQIHLDAGPGIFGPGLTVTDRDSVIRGFAITGFGPGVALRGTNNAVTGCWIGLRPDGSVRGNTYGVFIGQAADNRVGGTDAAERNVISDNGQGGILVTGSPGCVIAGNLIGTDPSGVSARPNERNGILLQSAGGAVVGGTQASARNVISGHSSAGLSLVDTGGQLIANNVIGLDVAGLAPLPNGSGIELFNVTGVRVLQNIVSGNFNRGIVASGNRDGNNIVTGNQIGTDASGTRRLGNRGGGIAIGSVTAFQVGGVQPGEGNRIAFNDGPGVEVSAIDTPVAIRGNEIFENLTLGIERGRPGPTPNDSGDADGVVNHPVLSSATLTVSTVRVAGTMNGAAGQNYRIDLYASRTPDTSGFGEGAQFLGSTTKVTDGSGFAAFDLTLPVVATGRWITATATDASGDTSEFSRSLRALSTRPTATFVVTTTADDGPGSLREALTLAGTVQGADNSLIHFNISGEGSHVITPASPLPVPVEAVTLDGFSQPGSQANDDPERDAAVRTIHLDGALLSTGDTGLIFAVQDSLVRGLVFSRFAGGALALAGNSNRVEGCHFVSNQVAGLRITGGSGHRIGGAAPAQRNRFVENAFVHITVGAGAGGDLRVQNNFIGVGPDGVVGTSDFHQGIELAGAGPSLIGGATAAEANRMANRMPISIIGGRGHTVRGNRVAADGFPIPDLPVFGNDPGDADTGANDLQNSPAITQATVIPAGTRIRGTLGSTPASTFALDFYFMPAFGQILERYLGATSVTTDASGNTVFEVILPVRALRGRVVATATDAAGSTSETGVSAVTTTEVTAPQLAVTTAADSGPGSLRLALTEAATAFATGPATISFNVPGPGPHLIEPMTPLPAVGQPVTLDGFTQPGTMAGQDHAGTTLRIQIHGAGLGPDADGLVLSGPGQSVRGLIFSGFSGRCLVLSNAPGSRIEQNWFGYDGVTGVAAGLRSAGKIRPQVVSSVADLEVGSAIDLVGRDAFRPNPAASTDLLNNLIANIRQTGIGVTRSSDVALRGISIGLGQDGQRFGIGGITGISLEEVSRIEVTRGAGEALFGPNRVAGCVTALSVRNSRDVVAQDNIFGGGEFGNWKLKNDWAIRLDGVQNSVFAGNNAAFNRCGILVEGAGFGTRVVRNFLWNAYDYGMLARDGASGYRLGEFNARNFLGGGNGSVVALEGNGTVQSEYNEFGTQGLPVLLGPRVVTRPAPTVALEEMGLTIGGFNARSFDRIVVATSDPWNQRLAPQTFSFLENGQTSVTYPLNGPLLSDAHERILSALMLGGSYLSRWGFKVDGDTDLSARLIPVGEVGPGGVAGTTRQLVEVHFVNHGSEPASYFAALDATSAMDLTSLARLHRDPAETGPFSLAPTRRALFGATEMQFTGRLQPGQEIVEMVALTQAPNSPVTVLITAVDRLDTNPANNEVRAGFSLPVAFPAPTHLEILPGGLSTASTLGDGVLRLSLRNEGPDPASGVIYRIADAGALEWKPQSTDLFQSVRNQEGINVTFKRSIAVGERLEFGLTYRALNRPGHFIIPGAAVGFSQVTTESVPMSFGVIQVQDATQLDYGDAPNTYGTTRTSNGPRHIAVPGFQLGFEVAAQSDGDPGVNANRDRDEEGVYFPEPLVPGTTVLLEVQASASGRLDAWFDWNRDGDFDHRPSTGLNEYLGDAVEGHPQPGTSYPLQPGLNRLRLRVPEQAITGASYARFRFSHDGNLTPLGIAGAGEVEDHRIDIYPNPPDFGDAPDSESSPGYPTLPSHDGAVHFLTPDSPRLGVARDAESFPQVDPAAFGDDSHRGGPVPETGVLNDEDGVTLLGFFRPGQQARVQLVATVPGAGSARVDGWVDWNADFDWDDAGEQVARSLSVSNGTNAITVVVPPSAIPGFTFARIRISRDGGLSPRGAVVGGEVEDYSVVIIPAAECRITSYVHQLDSLLIFWEGAARLEEGPSLSGPWIPVSGQLPDSARVSLVEQAQFFRLQCQ